MKIFNEWKSIGYSIKKGEKSRTRNERGECLFSDSQVKENLRIKEDGVDYIADAEFWAKANPQAFYRQMVNESHRVIPEKAGAILTKNLY